MRSVLRNARPLAEPPNFLPGALTSHTCQCGEDSGYHTVQALSDAGWVFVVNDSGRKYVWCPQCSQGNPSPATTLRRTMSGHWWARATHAEGGYP